MNDRIGWTIRSACYSAFAAVLALALGCYDSEDHSLTSPFYEAALTLTAEPSSVPADGVSTATITARISPSAAPANRIIEFETDAGEFVGPESNASEVERAVDGTGRATVELRSSGDPGTVVVRARVQAKPEIARSATVQFGLALPDSIIVEPDGFQIEAGFGDDSSANLAIRLERSSGKPSPGLVVNLIAVDAATGTPLQLFFRGAEPSSAEGRVSAVVTAGPTEFRGVARIEARVDGSPAVGMANIEIIDP